MRPLGYRAMRQLAQRHQQALVLNCTSSHESLGSSFDYKVGHATNKKTHHKRAYSSHIPSCGLPEVPCSTRLHSGWLLWFFFCVWERWAFDRIQLPAPCSPTCVFPEQLLGLGQQSPYSLLVPSIVTDIWEKNWVGKPSKPLKCGQWKGTVGTYLWITCYTFKANTLGHSPGFPVQVLF